MLFNAPAAFTVSERELQREREREEQGVKGGRRDGGKKRGGVWVREREREEGHALKESGKYTIWHFPGTGACHLRHTVL